jgi:hypothetical protein
MLDADQHLAAGRRRRLGKIDKVEDVLRRAETSNL